MSDEDDLVEAPPEPEKEPLSVSLGEILEAHHRRLVERIRARERKELDE